MAATSGEFGLLIKSTGRLYLHSVIEAAASWARGFRYFLLQAVVFVAVSLLLRVTGLGATFAGGLLLSIFFTFLAAGYLGTIEGCVIRERRSPRESLDRAKQLFSPTLSVFFAFWVLGFIASHLLVQPEQQWMLISFSMILAVVFNVAPEAIYSARGVANPLAVSFEFMGENFIEWSLPWLILVGIVWCFMGSYFAVHGLIALVTINPVELPRMLLSLGPLLFVVPSYPAFAIVLLLVNFVMIWRGILFRELSQSSRRKRIYGERTRG